MTARGVLHVHSCLPAICPHVSWAASRALGVRIDLQWSPQPAAPGTLRSELAWSGPAGTAGRLASMLQGWSPLRFEMTEEPAPGCDGVRYSYTPSLGLFSAVMSANGDVLVREDRLRALLGASGDVRAALNAALGTPWDDELEPYRYAGDNAPVRLTRVV
ncbi:MAG: DUF3145 domain-containing protein [Actinomycetota bacterium]|nr:DUF3145 domain-containing protein [Actinomycetota bacterium]